MVQPTHLFEDYFKDICPVSDRRYWWVIRSGLDAGIRYRVDVRLWHFSECRQLTHSGLHSAIRCSARTAFTSYEKPSGE